MFSPKDRETKKPRGFTFCQYRRKEDAAEAVKGMDKRVGYLTHDFSHTPLHGWTGGMSFCEHTSDTSEHTHCASDTDLCCGVDLSGPSLWGQGSHGVLCIFCPSRHMHLHRNWMKVQFKQVHFNVGELRCTINRIDPGGI